MIRRLNNIYLISYSKHGLGPYRMRKDWIDRDHGLSKVGGTT